MGGRLPGRRVDYLSIHAIHRTRYPGGTVKREILDQWKLKDVMSEGALAGISLALVDNVRE